MSQLHKMDIMSLQGYKVSWTSGDTNQYGNPGRQLSDNDPCRRLPQRHTLQSLVLGTELQPSLSERWRPLQIGFWASSYSSRYS